MKTAVTRVQKTKKAISVLSISIVVISLISCNGGGDTADGYGNFEATETTVSAEANGKIQLLNIEEGSLLQNNEVVGVIDTIQLSLKRDHLKATKKYHFLEIKKCAFTT
jgi:HlyD family secretion protein